MNSEQGVIQRNEIAEMKSSVERATRERVRNVSKRNTTMRWERHREKIKLEDHSRKPNI